MAISTTLQISAAMLGVQRQRGVSVMTFLAMIVVMALMVAISVPIVARQHRTDAAVDCAVDLVRLENAKIQYTLDHKLQAGATVTIEELIKAYPKRFPDPVRCPAGGTYNVGAIGEVPTCSLAEQGHLIRRVVSRDRAFMDLQQ